MKGFILVTSKDDGLRDYIPISEIKYVTEYADGTAFIATYVAKKQRFGFFTKETFSEVVQKIQEATE